MSEEEKKAIKYFYNLRTTIDESKMLFDEDINVKCGKEMVKQITIFLNLIEKQQADLEKKDKIIDEIKKYAIQLDNYTQYEKKHCKLSREIIRIKEGLTTEYKMNRVANNILNIIDKAEMEE